jgi:hypothetical protein
MLHDGLKSVVEHIRVHVTDRYVGRKDTKIEHYYLKVRRINTTSVKWATCVSITERSEVAYVKYSI